MKNAKYLLVIAAFATLAIVGFSAFTTPSDKVDAAGKGAAEEKTYYGVASIQAPGFVTVGQPIWYQTRAEAEELAKAAGANVSDGTKFLVIEVYGN